MGKVKAPAGVWLNGTVHWFDAKSGDGMVTSDDGESLYVHYSAIQSNKRRKTLRPKRKVKFQVVEDITFKQVAKIKEV